MQTAVKMISSRLCLVDTKETEVMVSVSLKRD